MRPDHTLGYWMIRAAHSFGTAFVGVLQAHCTERGKPYMITPPQWGTLAWLDEYNGLPIGTLAQYLGIEASVTTGIVKRLEQNGLVERVHDREDRRIVKVYLTAEGQDLVRSLDSVITTFNERPFQGFSHEERQTFLEQLHRILINLSDDADEHASLFNSFRHQLNEQGGWDM